MARRALDDWLTGYLKYTDDTESHPRFHRWVGLCLLAGALQKKTWLALGRLKVYPNLYVILVSEPGVARKSQAISWGRKILANAPTVNIAADATTPRALIEDLEQARAETPVDGANIISHSSLTIMSKEMATFLGNKRENYGMITFLTDIFDAEDIPFKYRTKHAGSNEVTSPYLNLLAATTPSSICDQIPTGAIGGGFTSRIIFVCVERRLKAVAEPEMTPEIEQLERALIHDLSIITHISGAYYWKDQTVKDYWHNWYNRYDDRDPSRICDDPVFAGWYSRKPLFLQKLMILSAASRSDARVIDLNDISRAFSWIEEVEKNMGETFKSVGRSETTAEVSIIIDIIRKNKQISERALKAMVWRDINQAKWDDVIETAINSGKVLKRMTGEGFKATVWYYWAEHVVKVAKQKQKESCNDSSE